MSRKPCFCGKAIRPYFGIPGGKPTHCGKCKTDSMCVLRVSKKCFCGKAFPSFGLKDGQYTHCAACKTEEMNNVKDKRCACGKSRPTFGTEVKKPTHCAACKTDDMRNVIKKECFCGKMTPMFGIKDKKPTHCSLCKTAEMRNVMSKRCVCNNSIATFGVKNGKPTHCASCKTDGMRDVRNKRCFCGKSKPIFGITDKKPTHCAACKIDGMRNIVDPRCATCGLFIVPRKGRQCWTCRTGSERAKHEELSVKAALDADMRLALYTTHDTSLTCRARDMETAERPDFVWLLPAPRGALILEVDEHAHRHYERACENARLTRLADALACAVTVVRYNPHASWVKLGKRKRSEESDDHSFLVGVLHAVLNNATLEPDIAIQIRGNDGLRVVYLGYMEADVNDFEG